MWPIVTTAVWSVRVLVVFVRPVKSGRADQDDVWVWIHRSPRNHVLYGGTDPPWEGAVLWDIFWHQDQDAVLGVDSWEPRKLCVVWRHRYPVGTGSFVGHIFASRSRCHFGCGFMAAQKTVCYMEVQIPHGMGQFCGTYFGMPCNCFCDKSLQPTNIPHTLIKVTLFNVLVQHVL